MGTGALRMIHPVKLDWDVYKDTLIEQCEQGVDYFTIHAGVRTILETAQAAHDDGESFGASVPHVDRDVRIGVGAGRIVDRNRRLAGRGINAISRCGTLNPLP
jgi:Radical SAM ThiC family